MKSVPMPENARRFLLFGIECVGTLLFAGAVIAAELLCGALVYEGNDGDSTGVCLALLLFVFLQRASFSQAYKTPAFPVNAAIAPTIRHVRARLLIPCMMFAGGLVGWAVDAEQGMGSNFGLGAYVFILWLFASPRNAQRRVLRGTELISFDAAVRLSKQFIREGETLIRWGNLWLPERFAEGHFGLVGTIGSGKTQALRHLMQSVLIGLQNWADARAVIYDAKRDVLSILAGLELKLPIIVANPFDQRSAAWDMAADLTDPAAAVEIASILIPARRNESHPFFSKAAQALVAGVIKALIITRSGSWTLRDVLIIVSSAKTLREALTSTPDTKPLIEQYFEPETTFQNILQTIATETAALEPIAALWAHSEKRFSLREWSSGNSILVLGSDWTYSEAMRSVNRLLFRRLTQLVLNGSESRERRTWFFIDELKEAGNLEGLTSLMSAGRSKGVRVAIAFQDIDALRHVFEERPANEIIGLCRNKSLLRIDSEGTARWAAQTIGEELGIEITRSASSSSQGESTSTNEHIYKREAVLASEFMGLPPPNESVFSGFHIVPAIGVYRSEWAYREGLIPAADIPNFIPRPQSDQALRDGETARIGQRPIEEPRASIALEKEPSRRITTPRITRDLIDRTRDRSRADV